MDWKLELVAIPVSDVDRAKAFYAEKVGFNADHDYTVSDEIRFVQLTPPGSACSIAIGKGLVDTQPGSAAGLQLVVPDIQAARDELAARGVEVSEIQEFPWGSFTSTPRRQPLVRPAHPAPALRHPRPARRPAGSAARPSAATRCRPGQMSSSETNKTRDARWD